MKSMPDKRGYYGEYGGRFVPESLINALCELEDAYRRFLKDTTIRREHARLLRDYAGRPTPVYHARRLSEKIGLELFLKREDLVHTGSHKLNNTLGQILLARSMGKRRVIAETGAGQHGVATATAAALTGMECRVYMGAEDVARQAPNVHRIKLLGAEVVPVETGQRTLKDAVSEAMRDWVASVRTTHYLIGSVIGPAPFPRIVRDFQSVIGREARSQMRRITGRDPDVVVACVGGGSNAAGVFSAYLGEKRTALVGVEAGAVHTRPATTAPRSAGDAPASSRVVAPTCCRATRARCFRCIRSRPVLTTPVWDRSTAISGIAASSATRSARTPTRSMPALSSRGPKGSYRRSRAATRLATL